jgi:hypothetical protein
MHPNALVTLSNENGPSRSRPSLHPPPAACARDTLTTVACRPNQSLAHPPAGRSCSALRSAGRRSAEGRRRPGRQ